MKHHVLNNKRHVMTKTEDGNVNLWDVTQARLIAEYGNVNFEEKAKELQESISVNNWFTAETSTGVLIST